MANVETFAFQAEISQLVMYKKKKVGLPPPLSPGIRMKNTDEPHHQHVLLEQGDFPA